MLDKIIELKNKVVNKVKSLDIVPAIEIGSGIAILTGLLLMRIGGYTDILQAENVTIEDYVSPKELPESNEGVEEDDD